MIVQIGISDCKMVFDSLKAEFSVSVNEKCGTHVHVSIGSGWNLGNLKNLAISILAFEDQVDGINPRRSEQYLLPQHFSQHEFEWPHLG
jgi:hypothetical protein